MGKDSNGSPAGRTLLCVAIFTIASLATQSRAGVADVNGADQQKFTQTLISHEAQNPAVTDMYLPDPAQTNRLVEGGPAIPEITIPQMPPVVTTTSASNKDGVNAIPLPPALQSGLAGMAALGLAAGLRRLHRILS
jgi:hypothetical protein